MRHKRQCTGLRASGVALYAGNGDAVGSAGSQFKSPCNAGSVPVGVSLRLRAESYAATSSRSASSRPASEYTLEQLQQNLPHSTPRCSHWGFLPHLKQRDSQCRLQQAEHTT